jgi:hypothetical protein
MSDSNVPTPNDLSRVVTSATARKVIYGAYVLGLIGAGATTVGFAAVGGDLPQAIVVTNAVLGYLGIPIGGLALANTVSSRDVERAVPGVVESEPAKG